MAKKKEQSISEKRDIKPVKGSFMDIMKASAKNANDKTKKKS